MWLRREPAVVLAAILSLANAKYRENARKCRRKAMIIGLCRIYRGRAFRLRCRVHAGSTFPKPPVLRKVQKMARNVARCAAVRRIVLNFDVSRI